MAEPADDPAARPRRRFYRHRLPVRLTHWANLLFLTIMVMSGLQIFNAHSSLYLGSKSDLDNPVLAMDAVRGPTGEAKGITTILGHDFDTTGVLGLFRDPDGGLDPRGFPAWATLPGSQWLAMGRRWHFFFAWLFVINGLIFAFYTLFSRHLWRDLLPGWREIKHLGGTLRDHLMFRFTDNHQGRYNVLQKLTYLLVIFVLGPLVVLTGLTLSPWIDSTFTWLPTILGGRQTARTIHFICAFSFIAFVVIHILMVLVSGVWNNLRSMLTGRYVIKE